MLGRAVRVARTVRKMSRKGLADAAGISYPYLSEIENDKKAPSPKTLNAISGALGLKPYELMETADRLQHDMSAAVPLSYKAESREAPAESPSWFRNAETSETTKKKRNLPRDVAEALEDLSDEDLEVVMQLVERLRARS